jgi:c-di-GMP-binding flagellar brake protein YcgR
VATRSAVQFQVGDVLRGCRIELPDVGEVEVNLQIRHVLVRGHLGYDAAQAGCEFVELAPAAQRKLFRYLLQLDRDQLARRRALE